MLSKREKNALAERNWREFIEYGRYMAAAWRALVTIYAVWLAGSSVLLLATPFGDSVLWQAVASVWAMISFGVIIFTFLGAPLFVLLAVASGVWGIGYVTGRWRRQRKQKPFAPIAQPETRRLEAHMRDGMPIVGDDGELLLEQRR